MEEFEYLQWCGCCTGLLRYRASKVWKHCQFTGESTFLPLTITMSCGQRSWLQAAETSFLCRVAQLCEIGWRSLVIHLISSTLNEPVGLVQVSDQDASCAPPKWMGRRPQGRITLGNFLGSPLDELGKVAREREVWASLALWLKHRWSGDQKTRECIDFEKCKTIGTKLHTQQFCPYCQRL